MIIDLVVPPSRDDTVAVSRAGFFSPLGLLSIATYAIQEVGNLDIAIWDGNILPEYDIQPRPEADIVGLSPTILSYEACLRLARTAKANGSTVVLGGYHATSLGERVLESHEFIDHVIDGDGEMPFTELIRGMSPRDIPGLIYRNLLGVQRNPPTRVPLDDYPFPDRELIDRGEYVKRFRAKYLAKGFRVPDLIVSQKDCMWASKTGGCVFCARIDKEYRARSVDNVWQEITWLSETYGTDYVWDVTGSFIGNPDWVRAFHAARPRNVQVALEIYGRAAEITPEIAQMMEDVGVHKVFIGAESGDKDELRRSVKGSRPETNIRAARLCADHGIALSLGFVVGLPGETRESLDRTMAHVHELANTAEVETISCAVLLPIPGSKSFRMLSEHSETAEKYAVGDHWDLEEMQRDWLRIFTQVDYTCAVDVAEQILACAPTKSAILRFKENAQMGPEATFPVQSPLASDPAAR